MYSSSLHTRVPRNDKIKFSRIIGETEATFNQGWNDVIDSGANVQGRTARSQPSSVPSRPARSEVAIVNSRACPYRARVLLRVLAVHPPCSLTVSLSFSLFQDPCHTRTMPPRSAPRSTTHWQGSLRDTCYFLLDFSPSPVAGRSSPPPPPLLFSTFSSSSSRHAPPLRRLVVHVTTLVTARSTYQRDTGLRRWFHRRRELTLAFPTMSRCDRDINSRFTRATITSSPVAGCPRSSMSRGARGNCYRWQPLRGVTWRWCTMTPVPCW